MLKVAQAMNASHLPSSLPIGLLRGFTPHNDVENAGFLRG
jgi:hypothetical protein